PFYPANNNWRIKPSRPESGEQIRSRIKNCVHFYALFFKDNAQRQEKDISFIGLPGCFTWYNGGIALTAFIEIGHDWKDCFYSDDQAMTGYNMLNDLMQQTTFKWPPHTENWVKQTESVLEQMYAKL
ncbi:MAG TPA: hypothetical protein VMI35_04705, partial [Puia sp.]|nr:hypothetical protein [Puia sp.]